VCFSSDGKVLGVGCKEGMFYIWKWQTERQPKPMKSPDGDQILPQFFTPDGKRLVSGSSSSGHQSGQLHVWDVATGTKVLSFPGDKESNALAISPDGKWAVSCGESGRPEVGGHIDVFDLEKGIIVREIRINRDGGAALAFSPDGRVLAVDNSLRDSVHVLGESDVKLIEFATGQTIATFQGHHSGVFAFQFSPDGRTLYSGGCDSTILKWDATARHGKGRSTPNPAAAWEALAQEASKAYPARWDLVDAAKQAIELLRAKIKPAKKLGIDEILPMVDMLDSDKFAVREKAAKDLQSLGYAVEPILRKLFETEKRQEVKQRLESIIDRLLGDVELLRVRRALQVLETIGSEDAKRLLRELADGAPDSMLTREAASVLKRMAK
jgi:hypothetical protein